MRNRHTTRRRAFRRRIKLGRYTGLLKDVARKRGQHSSTSRHIGPLRDARLLRGETTRGSSEHTVESQFCLLDGPYLTPTDLTSLSSHHDCTLPRRIRI